MSNHLIQKTCRRTVSGFLLLGGGRGLKVGEGLGDYGAGEEGSKGSWIQIGRNHFFSCQMHTMKKRSKNTENAQKSENYMHLQCIL